MWQQNANKSVKLIGFFICICLLLLGCGIRQNNEETGASSEAQNYTKYEERLPQTEKDEQTKTPITPTPEPTEALTPKPTEASTPKPTEEPTPEPTEKSTPGPTEKSTPDPTKETGNSAPEVTYVVNTNTKKFHKPSCSSVKDIKESNRWDFTGTREELIEKGYVPCKRCNP